MVDSMLIRGEISDPYTRNEYPGEPGLATVTVEITVLKSKAKEAMDLLVNTAWEFGTSPA